MDVHQLIPATAGSVSIADTVFVIVCSLLVLFMIPGLGFFYAGLDRKKYVMTMIMQSLVSIPLTSIIWIFWGFGLAFGPNIGGGILGNPTHWLVWEVIVQHGYFTVDNVYAPHVPLIAFFIYQLMFAIITPPLMTGAFADRMTWGKYIVFIILWQYLVYIPVCHWVWGGGFLAQIGVLDWAGGIVIHTTAGFGALATVLVLGKRKPLSKGKEASQNKNSSNVLVMLGIAFLWFGWFGFNSGGAMALNGQALRGCINTALAPCFAMITWMILEYSTHHKKMSALSVAGSFVAGLAGITPCAGLVPIWAGFPIGAIVACASFGMVTLVHLNKHVDDAMDVFSVHGITGFVGALLIGAFIVSPAPGLGAAPIVQTASGVFAPAGLPAGIYNQATTVINGTTYFTGGLMPGIYYSAPTMAHGYQFGIELGAVCLVAAWSFGWSALLVFGITTVSKYLPWSLKEYKSSFEEEKVEEEQYIEDDKEPNGKEVISSYDKQVYDDGSSKTVEKVVIIDEDDKESASKDNIPKKE